LKDEAHFGLEPGIELEVHTALCFHARASRAPLATEHANADPRWWGK
jgi:hypothetical protein